MPKDTVTDVNKNGKPDLNDADQPGADQPTIKQTPAVVNNNGHVTTPAETVITPGKNNDQMTITYYPEDTAKDADHGQEVGKGATAGSPETLKVVKGKDGQWQPEGATVEELADKGIAVDPDTGAVTFEPNAILGGTEIKAEGTVAGSKPATATATADIDTPAHDQWYTVSLSEFQGDANAGFANGITADYLVNKTPKFNEEDASKGDVLIDGSSNFTEELHVEFTDKDGKDQSLTLKRMSDKDGQTGVGRPAELADYKADWAVVNDDGTVNAEATLQYFRASNDNSASNRFVLKGDNLNDGQEVSVWATNHLGVDKPANTGDWETYQPVTADKTPTADAPDVQAIDNGAATVKPGDDNTTLTVTATDEKGETHTSTLEKQNGSWVCEDFWDKGLGGENSHSDDNNLWVDLVKELNENGEFTIPGQYLQDDSKVIAKGTNADELFAEDLDTVGVNAAVTAITGIAGDDFEVNEKDINDGKGKVTITGTTKGTTGGETVTLTVDGKEIGTATVNADGTFSAEVNVGDLTNVSDADRKVTASIEGAGKIEAYTVEVPPSKSFSGTIFENSSNGYGSQDHIKFTDLDDHVVLTHPNPSGGLGIQNSNTIIEALDGNDYLEIQGSNGVPGILGYISNNTWGTTGDKYIQVNMGSGDDELVVNGSDGGNSIKYKGAAIWESQVDMGSGDDVVNVGGAIKATTSKLLDTYVDGGAGYDTLNITGSGVTQSMATLNPNNTSNPLDTNFIKGFEVIDLGDSGNSLTNVTWTAIQNNNAEQALRILSDGGMGSDASVGLDSTWKKQVDTETADGVTYDVYRSTSNTAGNDHLDIWIQQGIDII